MKIINTTKYESNYEFHIVTQYTLHINILMEANKKQNSALLFICKMKQN